MSLAMTSGPTTRQPRALSTGLPGLDQILKGLHPGDNVVWQVGGIEDYIPFVVPFCLDKLRQGKRLVYFRFARHGELVPAEAGAEIHRLMPEVGFETFTAEIHNVIGSAGRGTCYVFDALSDLAADWYSDLMLANFFQVTCPYLRDLDTLTYFALIRDSHSHDTVASIRDTTQLLLDVFRHRGNLYVHPLKAFKRHSPTMYLPHLWEGEDFRPLTNSAVLAELLAEITEQRGDSVSPTLDMWDRKFLQVREALEGVRRGARRREEAAEIFLRTLRMMVTRDERVIALASRHLDLPDLFAIRKRMIGTGLIGGKSVGMLLARAILYNAGERWRTLLEPHDSFFIGSDVFYTYLVRNGCWHARREQRGPTALLQGTEAARRRILGGSFPDAMCEQFISLLEYFGQSPIIVRSSSLLEDGFGNAFTGKYESVFCPNQGSPRERLEKFLAAMRRVYASTMNREALLYRAHRGLLDRDEQMALLVQRVSGTVTGHLFYPQVAGVGLSVNPYAWSEYIDPKAGVLRIVFGLGTRAVERSDDDYTRVVALNDPTRRPETGLDEIMEYTQRRVDVLDLKRNRFSRLPVEEVLRACPEPSTGLLTSQRGVPDARRPASASGATPRRVLTFDRLLTRTPFVHDMREMLAILQDAYDYPVDVEFTANFFPDESYRINLVQCRPLQVREGGAIVEPPAAIPPGDLILESRGPVIGESSLTTIDRLIYVVPSRYGRLPMGDRYTVARLIGRLTHWRGGDTPRAVMLLGPGRWGTRMPSLGVPVTFAEINTISVLCEIVAPGLDVVPNVSLGTHFFNDLVEGHILYLAVSPAKQGHALNEQFLLGRINRLPELLPGEARWAEVVRVIDLSDGPGDTALYLNANSLTQRALCYLGALRA